MTSRALFFNLMKEDFKKKVWIVVVALIAFIFVNPVHTLMVIEASYSDTYLKIETFINSMQYYLGMSYFGNTVLPAILAVVLGIAGFSFLFSKKKVDLYHSIPVKREKLFFVSYINGILIYIGVYLITQILTIMTMAMQGLMTVDSWATVAGTFVGVTLHFLFFYHVAIIAVMLTGNMLVCTAATMTLLFYGPMVGQMLDGFLSNYFVTYYANYVNSSWLIMPLVSPVSSLIYYISLVDGGIKGSVGLAQLTTFLISAALLAAAVWLYKKRPSEVAGKALSYRAAEPVIRILVVIPIALMGGLYIQNMSNGLSGIWFWFGLLFTGILCHALMEVIYRFDFRAALNHKIQLAASMLVAALIALCFQYDWVGYDTYIPSEDQVESAAVVFESIDRDMNSYEMIVGANGNNTLTYKDKTADYLENMYLTDVTDVLALAGTGIEQLDYSTINGAIPRAAARLFGTAKATRVMGGGVDTGEQEEKNIYTIKYRLKNGREVIRHYSATIGTTIDAMAAVYSQPEYKQAAYKLTEFKDQNIISAVNGNNGWDEKVLSVTGEDMQELLDIYTEELNSLTIETMQQELPILRLDSIYSTDEIYGYEDSIYGYYVYPSFKKTISKLKELGVNEEEMVSEIKAEDVMSINVNDYGYLASLEGEENYNYSASVYYEAENSSDEEAKIKDMCDHLVLGNFLWTNSVLHPVENNLDFSVQLKRNSGKDKFGYAQLKRGEVPAFIIEDLRANTEYY